MEVIVKNFRRGIAMQKVNQVILEAKGVDTKEKANSFAGKKVVIKTESGKEIFGKVTQAHGNSGAMRARFQQGLCGQTLSSKAEIVE